MEHGNASHYTQAVNPLILFMKQKTMGWFVVIYKSHLVLLQMGRLLVSGTPNAAKTTTVVQTATVVRNDENVLETCMQVSANSSS